MSYCGNGANPIIYITIIKFGASISNAPIMIKMELAISIDDVITHLHQKDRLFRRSFCVILSFLKTTLFTSYGLLLLLRPGT